MPCDLALQAKGIKLYEIAWNCVSPSWISKSTRRPWSNNWMGADKKIAEQLCSIQKLNRDRDRRDQEIFNLKEADNIVVDMVRPLIGTS